MPMPRPSASGSARRGIGGRASATNRSPTRSVIDDLPTQGAVYTDEVMVAAAAGELMARRRVEDERFAYFAEASIVFLDLPDAVFRGYEGDDQLLGAPRDDDDAPYELLRREIARLEPQKVYLPLGVGGHVDHQLCREVGDPPAPGGPALGDARAGVRRHRHLLRGLPVRLVDRLRAAGGPRRRARSPACPATSRSPRSSPTSPTSSSARSRASTSTRASSSGCSTARRRWPTPCRAYGRAIAELGEVDGPRNATGSPAGSDRAPAADVEIAPSSSS